MEQDARCLTMSRSRFFFVDFFFFLPRSKLSSKVSSSTGGAAALSSCTRVEGMCSGMSYARAVHVDSTTLQSCGLCNPPPLLRAVFQYAASSALYSSFQHGRIRARVAGDGRDWKGQRAERAAGAINAHTWQLLHGSQHALLYNSRLRPEPIKAAAQHQIRI